MRGIFGLTERSASIAENSMCRKVLPIFREISVNHRKFKHSIGGSIKSVFSRPSSSQPNLPRRAEFSLSKDQSAESGCQKQIRSCRSVWLQWKTALIMRLSIFPETREHRRRESVCLYRPVRK